MAREGEGERQQAARRQWIDGERGRDSRQQGGNGKVFFLGWEEEREQTDRQQCRDVGGGERDQAAKGPRERCEGGGGRERERAGSKKATERILFWQGGGRERESRQQKGNRENFILARGGGERERAAMRQQREFSKEAMDGCGKR